MASTLVEMFGPPDPGSEAPRVNALRAAAAAELSDEDTFVAIHLRLRRLRTALQGKPIPDALLGGLAFAAALAPCSRREGFRHSDLVRLATAWSLAPWQWGRA